MIQQLTNSLYNRFIGEFELQFLQSAATERESIRDLRAKAFENFKRLGFPTTKVEDWKYVNLTPYLTTNYNTSCNMPGEPSNYDEVIRQASIPQLDCYRLITVNGKFRPDLSHEIPEANILVADIEHAYDQPGMVKHLGRYIDLQQQHFAALNTAFFKTGLFIEVSKRAQIRKPVHIIHITAAGETLFLQPRQLFVIDAEASATILESFVQASPGAPAFVNSVTEIVVGENAHLQHCSLQHGSSTTNHVQHIQVEQKDSSTYSNFKASFPGTALLRTNFNIALNGLNGTSNLYGLYLAGGKQLVDNHTTVDHLRPHCNSNELYKGVIKDEATAVFNGKIFVRKDAQKTNAFQKNNNLMLSKKGVVDSKPQLEIYADDVKCSHGSTIGQFDEAALFYLKARGIGDEKAKALLIHAFAFDVTEKIVLPELQDYVNRMIEEGLNTEHLVSAASFMHNEKM